MSWTRWRRRLRLGLELSVALAAAGLTALWASIPTVEVLAHRNPTTTAFIELRRRQAAEQHRPLTIQWRWRRLSQIAPTLRAAVVYAEDARFYEHEGVDWDAIEQAAEKNYRRGALSIGGSTITQQLAKNLYLSPSRSLVRKVREILIASRLEDALDKPRILELYLNVVEWGDGIFGAEAAAQHWFGRSARQLTAAQAARLAVALPNPFTRSPKARSASLQHKVARILWQLRRDGLIDRAELREAAAAAGLPPPAEAARSEPTAAPAGGEPPSAEPAGVPAPTTAAPTTSEVEAPPAAAPHAPAAASGSGGGATIHDALEGTTIHDAPEGTTIHDAPEGATVHDVPEGARARDDADLRAAPDATHGGGTAP